jgi:uncharacterized membrane protein YgcG
MILLIILGVLLIIVVAVYATFGENKRQRPTPPVPSDAEIRRNYRSSIDAPSKQESKRSTESHRNSSNDDLSFMSGMALGSMMNDDHHSHSVDHSSHSASHDFGGGGDSGGGGSSDSWSDSSSSDSGSFSSND